VAYQRNDLDAAHRYVTEGIARCRNYGDTQALATGLATLAWIRQAQGDAAQALDAMGEADQVAPGPDISSLLNPVPAQRARLLLTQGDVAGAARWIRERGLRASDDVSYHREREYLVLVRVLLVHDQPDDAAGLLSRLHAAAARQGRAGSLIEIEALQALALASGGEEPAAVAALADALTLGCPQGYVRVFTDEGLPMATLLGRLIAAQKECQSPARGIPLGYLGRVVRSFKQDPAGTGRSASQVPSVASGLAEPLTEREREVLLLLAVGKPNREIAAELVVSLHTVKKHVTHVLGKLGAANRTEATARARELGLLP
jgi:LuxR family maltose regulon positive regulatory protein